ncbi:ATP-binding protein [Herbaspirillum sp. alder98]|uniref:ATP-binding protein n=1 Tax=Herbaspirillum sp. alder98 TaxID=2913096 RepID=UPI001CD8C97F|nr:ATP-binding protein [Herbaspirillum sp. alder98]MCA1326220.1 ATP-binding protein [Herbaspirillum sp. alder98]
MKKSKVAAGTDAAVAVSSKGIIKLRSIGFHQPPFRKLGGIQIDLADRLTLIAGRNGVGKSTILALIAGGSGLTRGVKNHSYFGTLPNANAEEILKLSYARDYVKDDAAKPYALLRYELNGKPFSKKSNVSGSEERLRVVPRNDPKGPQMVAGTTIPADGKVPIPTIYLGMTRVLPMGEAVPGSLESRSFEMDPIDYELYEDFTNQVISTGSSGNGPNVVSQSVAGTKKRSVYPEYQGYDSTNVSLGQDSLSAIATALASFSKLKRTLGSDYPGGLLIIDEIDAGFHPHAQIELLTELKSKARQLDIQIIATTHSLTMLEHAHAGIYNEQIKGSPLDNIVYLKGGLPIQLLDASNFDAIYNDMHMLLTTPKPSPVLPTVKVYVEDEEAALFLDAILTTSRRKEILAKTECNLSIVAAKVGCSNLVGLLKADDYFKSVVIVLDADTTTVNAGNAKNVVRLPADTNKLSKQSPEVIIKAMCEKLCTVGSAYPETRRKLASVGADTSYIEKKILNRQRGETVASLPIEKDRDIAKNWFNKRLSAIQEMKLIEGWVADNSDGVNEFLKKLEEAVHAARPHLPILPQLPASRRKNK